MPIRWSNTVALATIERITGGVWPGVRRAGAVGGIALLLAGCAAKTVASPLAPDTRSAFGSIGVVGATFRPAVALTAPPPLGGLGGGVKAAAAGLGLGVLGAAGCFITAGYVPVACGIALLTPYWVGRGAVEGTLRAVPASERRESKAALLAAAKETDYAQMLLDGIVEQGSHRTPMAPPRPLPLAGPATADERPVYSEAIGQADTILEVALLQLALRDAPDPSMGEPPGFLEATSFTPLVDPWLMVRIDARVRVVRSADAAVLFERTFDTMAGRAKFTEWAENDARQFREALANGVRDLAWIIGTEVFGTPATDDAPDVLDF